MRIIREKAAIMERAEEKWIFCPVCEAKTRLRLLQKTVLWNFPLFCPKCKRKSIINARNYQIETIPPSARR